MWVSRPSRTSPARYAPIRWSRTQFGRRRWPAPALTPSNPRLSIVVLPFANFGGDPEQDYFVDGVTESLTTDLSRISGSFVIARKPRSRSKAKSWT